MCRESDATLEIMYSIEGDLARLRVPPPRPPVIVHRLWQHTCCECFIALAGQPGYHEFNFSPSGEWAAYRFAKYREGDAVLDEALNPRISVQRTAAKLDIAASIPLDRLSAVHACGKLALALSTVVEDEQGTLSYWALKHPVGKPDFHHPDSFILNLKAVSEQV